MYCKYIEHNLQSRLQSYQLQTTFGSRYREQSYTFSLSGIPRREKTRAHPRAHTSYRSRIEEMARNLNTIYADDLHRMTQIIDIIGARAHLRPRLKNFTSYYAYYLLLTPAYFFSRLFVFLLLFLIAITVITQINLLCYVVPLSYLVLLHVVNRSAYDRL